MRRRVLEQESTLARTDSIHCLVQLEGNQASSKPLPFCVWCTVCAFQANILAVHFTMGCRLCQNSNVCADMYIMTIIWTSDIIISISWPRYSYHDYYVCNIIYSTVGRSVANIYDLGVIFTEMRSAEVNILAEVGYRGYGLTYRATYNMLYSECATGKPFWVQRPNKLL